MLPTPRTAAGFVFLSTIAICAFTRSPAEAAQPASGKSAKQSTQTKRGPKAKAPSKDIEGSFQTFCKDWMDKVRAREGQTAISWEPDGDSVHGKYVQYDADYNCALTDSKPPIGKVSYRETWFEKRGKTVAEAQASTPRTVEIYDTTELFSYSNGKWMYR